MDNEHVIKAKELAKIQYLHQPNIVGMGIGYKAIDGEVTDEISIVILVKEKLPPAALMHGNMISPIIRNVITDVVQVGNIRVMPPLKMSQARTDRWRPAPPGVSIGHYKVTAGTFGAMVTERETGIPFILSNNHVMANSNDAIPGDAIYQPGPYDGGTPGDAIAKLDRFVKIDFGQQENGNCPFADSYAYLGNLLARFFQSTHIIKVLQVNAQAINYVDAALAKPDSISLVKEEILDIGIVRGSEQAVLRMAVEKSGRTTEYTRGEITMINATVTVDYGSGKQATYEDQLITGPISAGGDSGSLLVSEVNKKAVGLLFAGSNQVTIYNPIKNVLDELNVEI